MAVRIRPGLLQHRVAIYTVTEAADAYGKSKPTFNLDSTVWARVVPLGGRELELAARVDARITHRIEMRKNTAVTPRGQLVHNSRTFRIEYTHDVEEMAIMTHVFCEEVQ